MSTYIYLGSYIAAVSVVVAALFFPGKRLRTIAAVLGALALWLPFTIYKTSLGNPNPFTKPGNYELLGIRWNPDLTRAFILVNDDLRSPIPRLYSMPWKKERSPDDNTFDFDEPPHAYVGQSISLGLGGEVDVFDQPLTPPDLDKDKWYEENHPPMPIVQPKQPK